MKTRIAIIVSVVCVGLLLFFLGRQSQPLVANANDSNGATLNDDATLVPKRQKEIIPPAPLPRISKVETTQEIERVVVDVELNWKIKRFLDRWERFSHDLNNKQRTHLINMLANTHDALILAQTTLENAGIASLARGGPPNGFTVYRKYVDLVHAYALEQLTFLRPDQRKRFKKMFTASTFSVFGMMKPTIREMMGLESESPFANADKREEFKKELLLHYGYPIE